MKRLLSALAACAAALLASSCMTATPQIRIDRNYSLYESLSPKHQELVQQGRIAKGMSKSAVYLALGDPSRKVRGYRNDRDFDPQAA